MKASRAAAPWAPLSATRLILRALIAVFGFGVFALLGTWTPPSFVTLWAPVLGCVGVLVDVRSPGRLGLLTGASCAGIWLFPGAMSGSLSWWQCGVLGLLVAAWLWVSAASATGPLHARISARGLKGLVSTGLTWWAASALFMCGTVWLSWVASGWGGAGIPALIVAVLGCALLAALLWAQRR